MTSRPAHPGPLLRERREQKNLGMRELARIVEVDPGHLSKVERGAAEPSPALLAKLSQALELPAGKVLPLAGKLPAAIEAELAGGHLIDGILDGDRLSSGARRLIRRRSLAALAEREAPPTGRMFSPSTELEQRGWRVRQETADADGAPGASVERHVRFDGRLVLYRAATQVEMRFLLAHALAHVLLDETPACRFGIVTDREIDAGVLATILLVPARVLSAAMLRASAGTDAWEELGGIIDAVARDLGAPPWAVAERASEEGLFSTIADVPIA